MAHVPPALQIGSPVKDRRQSEYAVPSALRIGSPITEGPMPPHARPPLTRQTSSGSSNRISQLFPSHTSSDASIVSPSTISDTKRQSLPSYLVPATRISYSNSSTAPPPIPQPLAFTEETSYDPLATLFNQEKVFPPTDQSNGRARRVLDRFTSLNKGSFGRGHYNRLDDGEAVPSRGRPKDIEEEDEAVGYDLSSLGGLSMKMYEAQSTGYGKSEANTKARELDEASHAAEFESLEAHLGAGMTSIFHKPFTHTPMGPIPGSFPGHRRILSADEVADEEAKKAQVEAEKTGQVVAVTTDVPIDISDFAGIARDFESMRSLTAEAGLVRNGAETSYFFPEGEIPHLLPNAFNLTQEKIPKCQIGALLP